MKLVENLKAIDTGKRRHITEPFYSFDYKSESAGIAFDNYAREYSIILTLGASQWIAEDVIRQSGGKVIEHAVDKIKHQILEAVYGEFHRDLGELRWELRNELSYRDSVALQKLEKIMEKITL